MPARPLIQARALLRYTRPSGGASKARVPALVPPTAALHYRGYSVSSKLLASSSSSSSSSTSASNSTPDPGASQGWSSGTLLAVAAAAAVSGWGISSLVSGQSHNGPQIKAKSKNKKAKDDEDNDSDDNGAEKRKHDGFLKVANEDEEIGFANRTEMKEAISDIVWELGNEKDIISTDPDDLHAHGYSSWSSVNPDELPVAVAYPRNTEQVATIVRVCHRHRVPVVAYSGGTSLEGNFSAPYGGVSIDFAYMNNIIQVNKDDMDVVVQPSVGWRDLNTELEKQGTGLFFPVDPGPTAKIGGMIGTNCSGTNAVRYGTMKDWVINLTVVLSDGQIIKTRRRPRKSSAGYNLNSLFVGSEGTLGIVTEATLKLAVIPEQTSVAVVNFPSIRHAASAAASVMQAAIPVQCLEIMDEVQMRVVNLSGFTSPRVWVEKPTLFFKFAGTKAAVQEHIKLVEKITEANKGGDFEFAKDKQEQELLWSARKESLWSMLALRKEGEDVWSTDVAVPFSRLADIIEISKKEMDELGLFASILGHIGDGNFHESIMYNKENESERAKVEACVKNMVRLAIEMEGTCTGEHGVGWGKKESLLWEVGSETVGVMATIKKSLDPRWILNPGKIMDVPWERKDDRHDG
ncbi:FAD binding domain-containing protein [Trichoderma breve]|uniref:D-lactate dehydrogenase (cytochrome) n=1 Tax=Trichoderma breve TaxID=2034170 RepID=A0A9W9EE66_9HYPO|nr:FAD binding domain-containing protein [Trichoderma breve]KAJ4865060.1 FAD binding domain-containing protein [Trichoderma breve]